MFYEPAAIFDTLLRVWRKAPRSNAKEKLRCRSDNTLLPQTSPPPRSSDYARCHPPSWVLVYWRPQYCSTGVKQVCYMQEIERTSDRSAYGRPTSRHNGSSPSLHKRWVGLVFKRWRLVCTCLSSRAIHIELLESTDASSFICALRRFFALCGPVSILRCDQGTNVIAGKSQLGDALREMDQCQVKGYVRNHGCEWIFNPPYA